jgi:ADP-ribose pyrophosphatase
VILPAPPSLRGDFGRRNLLQLLTFILFHKAQNPMPVTEKKMTTTKTAGQTAAAAKILARETIFDGYHRLEMLRVQPRSLKHEGWTAEMEREVFFGKPIAVVLLYIPETDEILLNQQFRLGAMLAGCENPFMYECAAGAVDPGETAENAARREAHEETGCDVVDLEFVGKTYSSPGCMAEEFQMYIGRIAKAESGIFGHEHEGEEIKTHLLPYAKVMEMLDGGQIPNVTSSMILYWFARHRERLRAKWLKA